MNFFPYMAYKDSLTDWLGDIPDHWMRSRVKHVAMINMGQSPSSDDCNVDGIGIPFLQGNGEFGLKHPMPKQYCPVARKFADAGDLLFSVRAPVGAINEADQIFGIGRGLCAIKPGMGISKSFLWYFLSSSQLFLDSISTGSTFEAVSAEQLGNIEIAMPREIGEQAQIARFLDNETARIDALMEEQQRLIELLKEKRQAVISDAVTKGLDPTVPMKDSDAEWLGEVPACWSVVPFGLAFGYQEGPGIMAADFRDEGVPLVRISGVQGRWVTLRGCNYLDPVTVDGRWDHFRLERGDLIISGSASMGLVSEVGEEAVGAVAYTGLIRLTPKAGISDRDFIRSVVGSYQFLAQIDLLKAGSTIQHFGPTHLGRMKVVLPPLDDQIEVAAYVDKVSAQFDQLLDEAVRTNDLLKERRSALISAAVTGKIDVRGWQSSASAQNPEFAQEVV